MLCVSVLVELAGECLLEVHFPAPKERFGPGYQACVCTTPAAFKALAEKRRRHCSRFSLETPSRVPSLLGDLVSLCRSCIWLYVWCLMSGSSALFPGCCLVRFPHRDVLALLVPCRTLESRGQRKRGLEARLNLSATSQMTFYCYRA